MKGFTDNFQEFVDNFSYDISFLVGEERINKSMIINSQFKFKYFKFKIEKYLNWIQIYKYLKLKALLKDIIFKKNIVNKQLS